jgi:hypothetical protein
MKFKEIAMHRLIATGMIASAVLFATFAVHAGSGTQTQTARFCAQYDFSTTNCGFYTAEQCLATISGVGGYCTRGLNGPGVYGSVGGWDTPAPPRRYRR